MDQKEQLQDLARITQEALKAFSDSRDESLVKLANDDGGDRRLDALRLGFNQLGVVVAKLAEFTLEINRKVDALIEAQSTQAKDKP